MIVGFGGGGIGISRQQIEELKHLLRRLEPEGAAHRGCTGMETMVHNVIRSIYPLIPIHVVPIAGKYSSIASTPVVPQTIIYQADTEAVVNDAILKTVHGLVFLPERAVEGGEGWDLVELARERSVPVILVWPSGKVTLERNDG